jgi:hypothetical protein
LSIDPFISLNPQAKKGLDKLSMVIDLRVSMTQKGAARSTSETELSLMPPPPAGNVHRSVKETSTRKTAKSLSHWEEHLSFNLTS